MKSFVRRGTIVVAVAGVALALAGVALAVKSSAWDGNTSQPNGTSGMPFSLVTSHNKVTLIYYGANYTGNSTLCARAWKPRSTWGRM